MPRRSRSLPVVRVTSPIATAAKDHQRIVRIRKKLLAWAEREGRTFFWRAAGLSPFEVLVCEILLAKTRAEVAEPVARALLDAYPTPLALSKAKRKQLERMLYPLGLHRKRAQHLVACAKSLVDEFAGEVPRPVAELMRLPFVGRYAANAIACVAFDEPVPVIDANVARIYQRVFSLPPPPPRLALAHDLWAFAAEMLPRGHEKRFNWAVLDLGGLICLAKAPRCERCPVASECDRVPAPSLSREATAPALDAIAS